MPRSSQEKKQYYGAKIRSVLAEYSQITQRQLQTASLAAFQDVMGKVVLKAWEIVWSRRSF
jgi:hypothetical protein